MCHRMKWVMSVSILQHVDVLSVWCVICGSLIIKPNEFQCCWKDLCSPIIYLCNMLMLYAEELSHCVYAQLFMNFVPLFIALFIRYKFTALQFLLGWFSPLFTHIHCLPFAYLCWSYNGVVSASTIKVQSAPRLVLLGWGLASSLGEEAHGLRSFAGLSSGLGSFLLYCWDGCDITAVPSPHSHLHIVTNLLTRHTKKIDTVCAAAAAAVILFYLCFGFPCLLVCL